MRTIEVNQCSTFIVGMVIEEGHVPDKNVELFMQKDEILDLFSARIGKVYAGSSYESIKRSVLDSYTPAPSNIAATKDDQNTRKIRLRRSLDQQYQSIVSISSFFARGLSFENDVFILK